MRNLNGILIIDKPKGFTSHDVVGKVRKILCCRRVGHTGTLDPDATGVLPVCIGKGTKVSDMLTNSDKEYVAEVKLGVVTDTQDISGKVISTSDSSDVTAQNVTDAILRFTGEIKQIPPMYSAIKINGQKMYDLARQGIQVERKPRSITVYSIELLNFEGDVFKIKVKCSKGTYIRTLCNDIGEYLGCGACMLSLRRTQSSVFFERDAITLEQLETSVQNGMLNSVLVPVDRVFKHLAPMCVNDEIKTRLKNGAPSTVSKNLGTYRVYDKNNNFIAVGEVSVINGRNKISVIKYFGE